MLSIFLANYNYRPIFHLASKISPLAETQENALQSIEHSIDELMDIRSSSAELITQNHELYLEGLLYKLIGGEILSDSLVMEYMRKYNLNICGPYVQLIFIYSENESIIEMLIKVLCLPLSDGEQEWHLLRSRQDIKLFYFGVTDQPGYDWVSDALSQYQDGLIIAFSNMHKGLTQLAAAYEETQKITDYMNFLGERGYRYYSEINQSFVSYDQNLTFETWFKKYANLLQDQNFEAANNIQRQIFDELKNNQYSLPFIKCKLFSFVDYTINQLAEMNKINENNLWEEYSIMERLMNCSSIEQMESEYNAIILQLSKQFVDADSQESMVDKIISITQEHYLDPMFNVFYVADRLNVSSSYVSKAFKKGTGRNMLDYVQRKRVDHAKELMKQTNLTIAVIAAQSGFCSDVSFNRVFKKMEGVTPGKYRSHISS